jgi:hypothetical protein
MRGQINEAEREYSLFGRLGGAPLSTAEPSADLASIGGRVGAVILGVR